MTDHGAEQIAPEEPEGGWVKSPALATEEILQIALCAYTGNPVDGYCPDRGVEHVDEPCIRLYVQASALIMGRVGLDEIVAAEKVTASNVGEPTVHNPVS